jgi:GDP-fucose transporter C1
LSLVFNVIFTYLILNKSTSILTCSTLLVVIVGFICGIQGEIDFSLVGTAAGVLSSVFVSLNSIYTSRVLPVVDDDKSMLLYYNNLNATVLFIPLIFLFETDVRTILLILPKHAYSQTLADIVRCIHARIRYAAFFLPCSWTLWVIVGTPANVQAEH